MPGIMRVVASVLLLGALLVIYMSWPKAFTDVATLPHHLRAENPEASEYHRKYPFDPPEPALSWFDISRPDGKHRCVGIEDKKTSTGRYQFFDVKQGSSACPSRWVQPRQAYGGKQRYVYLVRGNGKVALTKKRRIKGAVLDDCIGPRTMPATAEFKYQRHDHDEEFTKVYGEQRSWKCLKAVYQRRGGPLKGDGNHVDYFKRISAEGPTLFAVQGTNVFYHDKGIFHKYNSAVLLRNGASWMYSMIAIRMAATIVIIVCSCFLFAPKFSVWPRSPPRPLTDAERATELKQNLKMANDTLREIRRDLEQQKAKAEQCLNSGDLETAKIHIEKSKSQELRLRNYIKQKQAIERELEKIRERDTQERLNVLGVDSSHLDAQDFNECAARAKEQLGAMVQRLQRNGSTVLNAVQSAKDILAMDSWQKDGKTMLWNADAFGDARKNLAHLRANVSGDISLIALDLDHFKDVNDEQGHDAGDLVLSSVGIILGRNANDYDTFAFRTGGDEFAIMCVDKPVDQCCELAEKIRRTVEEREKVVRASFGVTAWQSRDDANTFCERADKALYEAKRQGRNRVARG